MTDIVQNASTVAPGTVQAGVKRVRTYSPNWSSMPWPGFDTWLVEDEVVCTRPRSPYKGTASYGNVPVGGTRIPDAAWGYATPLPEAAALAGPVAFRPEKNADLEVSVDGERIGRP